MCAPVDPDGALGLVFGDDEPPQPLVTSVTPTSVTLTRRHVAGPITLSFFH
jgi:hypothetical protein